MNKMAYTTLGMTLLALIGGFWLLAVETTLLAAVGAVLLLGGVFMMMFIFSLMQ